MPVPFSSPSSARLSAGRVTRRETRQPASPDQVAQHHVQGGGRCAIGSWSEEGMIRLAIAATVLCLITTLVGIGGAAAPDILPGSGGQVGQVGGPAPDFQPPG